MYNVPLHHTTWHHNINITYSVCYTLYHRPFVSKFCNNHMFLHCTSICTHEGQAQYLMMQGSSVILLSLHKIMHCTMSATLSHFQITLMILSLSLIYIMFILYFFTSGCIFCSLEFIFLINHIVCVSCTYFIFCNFSYFLYIL